MNWLEYIRQISLHRQRVYRVACRIYGNEHLVAKMMKLHDIEKWLFLPALLLVKNRKGDWIARTVYDAMNDIGYLLQDCWFYQAARDNLAAFDNAKDIERVIDVLDRNQDPAARKEFGRPNEPWQKFLTPPQTKIAESILIGNHWHGEFDNV